MENAKAKLEKPNTTHLWNAVFTEKMAFYSKVKLAYKRKTITKQKRDQLITDFDAVYGKIIDAEIDIFISIDVLNIRINEVFKHVQAVKV